MELRTLEDIDMELRKFVGKIVLLNLTEDFARENAPLFQSGPGARLLYGKIAAVDEMGVWVENDTWKSRPAHGGEPEGHRAHILVPWAVLISVATFPERTFPADQPVPDMKTHTIGFAHD